MNNIRNKLRLFIVLLYIFVYFSIFCFISNCFDYKKVIADQSNDFDANNLMGLSAHVIEDENVSRTVEQGEIWKKPYDQYLAQVDVANTSLAKEVAKTTTPASAEGKPEFLKPESSGAVGSNPPAPGFMDSSMTIINSATGAKEKHTYYDITCSLVMKELNNAHPEALKAQAVAAFTFVKYEEQCGITPAVRIYECSSIYSAIKSAVKSVVGVVIVKPGTNTYLYTPYCASTGGATASSENVWGGALSHLVSVESKYDNKYASYYSKTVQIPAQNLKEKIENEYAIEVDINDPSKWIKFLPASQGGVVDSIYVGKMKIVCKDGSVVNTTGHKFRDNMHDSLVRSASFKYTYEKGTFYFTSYGWGHGVGLSQKGADGYARYAGYKYDQILKHYYTGIELKTIK